MPDMDPEATPLTPARRRRRPSARDGAIALWLSQAARNRLVSLAPLVGALCFGVALWILWDALQHHRHREVMAALAGLPPQRLALAALLCAGSYAVLSGYDLLGFRWVARPLPPGRIVFGSFVSYGFSNNFGPVLIAGAAARYWIYSSFGVPAAEIARIVAFCSLGFWLGYLCLAAALFALAPWALPVPTQLPAWAIRAGALCLLLPVAAYALLAAGRHELRLARWRLSLPSPPLAAGQTAIGILDLLLMATTLWVLLPADDGLGYAGFLGIFLSALAAGVASQVPGGLGVFESAILLLLPRHSRTAEVMAALLAFRGIYYFAPLLLAMSLAGIRIGRSLWVRMAAIPGRLAAVGTAVVPRLLAPAVFLAGALLLFSGALPAASGRLGRLILFLPLPMIEVSHFLASLVGMLLLLLARGLQRRIDAAYGLTLGLLLAGMVFSLAKGIDYEEALALAAVFAALVPCRPYFYRPSALFAAPFAWDWSASIAIVLAGSFWLLAFASSHTEYSGDMWWQFALHAESSRSLRATVGAAVLGVLVAAARLLRPASPPLTTATAAEIGRARRLVEASGWTYAYLAYRRDKAFLFSRSGRGFLMYGRTGRSWIALGDPVAPREEAAELAWQFRELCDRYGGWPVFYEVRDDNLDLYRDLGLTAIKLGEEARVELAAFDLSGSARASLRQGVSRLTRLGYRFEIVPEAQVPGIIPEMAQVSEVWLRSKATREKGFSNASFDPDYLCRFPIAVVRNDAGIVAFANILAGGGREELSVDLMRHSDRAPNGTMDFLFVQLMLWGRQAGFRWFNLGMAPLAGLSERTGSPLWHRFGGFIYHYGEHFYNFRGLRSYKQKFGPVWSARYLAAPGGLALPAILLDVAACVSGGFAGILVR